MIKTSAARKSMNSKSFSMRDPHSFHPSNLESRCSISSSVSLFMTLVYQNPHRQDITPLERGTCEHEFPFSLRRTMRLVLLCRTSQVQTGENIQEKSLSRGQTFFLVHPARFELATPGSEDQCSNPLSYGCSNCQIYSIQHELVYQMSHLVINGAFWK